MSKRKGQLVSDLQVIVVVHAEQLVPHGCRPIQQVLAQPHSVLPYARVLVRKRCQQGHWLQLLQSDQCPENADPPLRMAGAGCQLFKVLDAGEILSFKQESVGCFPMPAIVVIEQLYQLFRGSLSQPDWWRLNKALGRHSVDPSSISAAGQIQVFLDDRVQAEWMLDHLAVHIGQVEAAIGRIGKLDWSKPDIGRPQEFRLLIKPLALVANSLERELFAMHQVTAHIADHGESLHLPRPGIPPVDGDSR